MDLRAGLMSWAFVEAGQEPGDLIMVGLLSGFLVPFPCRFRVVAVAVQGSSCSLPACNNNIINLSDNRIESTVVNIQEI